MAEDRMTAGAAGRPLRIAIRIVGAVSTACGLVAAALIFLSVLITCQMIFVRFVLDESTIWQTEAVTYMMIGATLLGLPYVQKQRGHVNVDLIPLLLPERMRRGLAIGVFAASILVLLVMVYYGWELFHVAYVRGWTSDTVWGPPLWIPYLAVPVGFALFILQLAADIVGTIAGEEG